MKKEIPIPNFPNIEAATIYAEKYQPFRRAMEIFQHPGLYSQIYGTKAGQIALEIWDAAQDYDQGRMKAGMRKLSMSLPQEVWEQGYFVRRP